MRDRAIDKASARPLEFKEIASLITFEIEDLIRSQPTAGKIISLVSTYH